jgi:hypothetical protein
MYNFSVAVYQMRSGLPRYFALGAQDSWQVLMFEDKTCSLFGS